MNKKTPNILFVSHTPFSTDTANGITYENMLYSVTPSSLYQFYSGEETADSSFCSNYYRVTDIDVLKSFFKFRDKSLSQGRPNNGTSSSHGNVTLIKKIIKRHNYNFLLRFFRTFIWNLSNFWEKNLISQLEIFKPQLIFYAVGDSVHHDRLVMRIAKLFDIPIVLYNCEAYRLVNPCERRGIERLFYRYIQNQYALLAQNSSLIVYNSSGLKNLYEQKYTSQAAAYVAYNTADLGEINEYKNTNSKLRFSYFGNLGVGRLDSLITLAKAMQNTDTNWTLDVYSNIDTKKQELLSRCPNIRYRGFVTQAELLKVKEESDVLVHVESFEPKIVKKLYAAFSTKVAQCLAAGRCLISYAPESIFSSGYLKENNAALVASSTSQLHDILSQIKSNPELLVTYSRKAAEIAKLNHDKITNSNNLVEAISKLIKTS